MCDGKDFYSKVNKELKNVTKELTLTRMGCQVSKQYIATLCNSDGANINPTRMLLTHDPVFSVYKEERVPRSGKNSPLVNKSEKMVKLLKQRDMIN
jgi:hypothetical protein